MGDAGFVGSLRDVKTCEGAMVECTDERRGQHPAEGEGEHGDHRVACVWMWLWEAGSGRDSHTARLGKGGGGACGVGEMMMMGKLGPSTWENRPSRGSKGSHLSLGVEKRCWRGESRC